MLGDEAYGKDSKLRERLDQAGFAYVLSIDADASVFAPETVFAVPPRKEKTGWPRARLRPDREPEHVAELIAHAGVMLGCCLERGGVMGSDVARAHG